MSSHTGGVSAGCDAVFRQAGGSFPETSGKSAHGCAAEADRACKKRAPGFARILKDVNPGKINSRTALAGVPVTRKSDLVALQKEMPPLGGLNATPLEKLGKLFMSPGPIYEPEGRGKNWWRIARGLFAGGFRAGDRV